MKTKAKPKRRKTLRCKKLSTLLALALREVKRCEKMPNVEVDMEEWIKRNGKCRVCVAGAVMLNCLELPRDREVYPGNFEFQTCRQLQAIDSLRSGWVSWAVQTIHGPDAVSEKHRALNRDVEHYHNDPKQWHADMKQLLADLRAAGL